MKMLNYVGQMHNYLSPRISPPIDFQRDYFSCWNKNMRYK